MITDADLVAAKTIVEETKRFASHCANPGGQCPGCATTDVFARVVAALDAERKLTNALISALPTCDRDHEGCTTVATHRNDEEDAMFCGSDAARDDRELPYATPLRAILAARGTR